MDAISSVLTLSYGASAPAASPLEQNGTLVNYQGIWGSEAGTLVKYEVFEGSEAGTLVKYEVFEGSEARILRGF